MYVYRDERAPKKGPTLICSTVQVMLAFLIWDTSKVLVHVVVFFSVSKPLNISLLVWNPHLTLASAKLLLYQVSLWSPGSIQIHHPNFFLNKICVDAI